VPGLVTILYALFFFFKKFFIYFLNNFSPQWIYFGEAQAQPELNPILTFNTIQATQVQLFLLCVLFFYAQCRSNHGTIHKSWQLYHLVVLTRFSCPLEDSKRNILVTFLNLFLFCTFTYLFSGTPRVWFIGDHAVQSGGLVSKWVDESGLMTVLPPTTAYVGTSFKGHRSRTTLFFD